MGYEIVGGETVEVDAEALRNELNCEVANSTASKTEKEPRTLGALLESLSDLRDEYPSEKVIAQRESDNAPRLSDQLTPTARRKENIEAALDLGFIGLLIAGCIALSIWVWPVLGVLLICVLVIFMMI